jgi:hypothetical protein
MVRLTELLWGEFIQTEENSSNPRLPDLLVQLTSDHLVRGDPALVVHTGAHVTTPFTEPELRL